VSAALRPFAFRRIFGVVQRLDACDVHRLVDAVTEIGSLLNDLPFPSEALETLGVLIPADAIEYSEVDGIERRVLGDVIREGDFREGPGYETFWRIRSQLPCGNYYRAGGVGAVRVSDLLTRRAFRGLELYAEWYRPWRTEYELGLRLPTGAGQSQKCFSFSRESRDFSERDRLLLNLLQPHLIRRHARWTIQQRAAARLAEIAESGGDPAVLILDHGGRIEFAQRAVRQLLNDYFGEGDHSFAPVPVREWAADREQMDDLVIDGPDGQLVVSAAAGDRSAQTVLLLHERRSRPPLTRRLTQRERDVLDLVGEGKSNAEIARLLWVQPSTIRKHLENAYAKLNVRSRFEATALLRREATQSDIRAS
jgi:DNA-binding CsgD family transcriptional regulator